MHHCAVRAHRTAHNRRAASEPLNLWLANIPDFSHMDYRSLAVLHTAQASLSTSCARYRWVDTWLTLGQQTVIDQAIDRWRFRL